ncbi:hypothetical protein LWE61_08055 [Sphingobium sufflavum]|uniref:hypothetical protein n=1 Tax=Sphingobium sufflavum TaxID=1129547 RepID=UPI001F3369FA|nr:hypothetical protein [Sphingobium sufflavum]MCE7796514.1 hypothetical protein [Sphingobium sufflavum]
MNFDPTDFSANDLEELWERDPAARGPVMLTLGKDMDELPLCGFCPNARWYVRDDNLRAFCKEFREAVFPSRGTGVTICDAYAIVSGRISDPAPEA